MNDAFRSEQSAVQPYNIDLREARQATPFDLELWKQWEGQRVDAEFSLDRCLGGSSRGTVFLTHFQDRPAAIKIVPGTSESIAALLTLWKKAAGLSHPALVPILARGETTLGDIRCAYIVMERADENLAEVLTERLLTPAETHDMLFPVLGALRYLQAKGFAHGGLKPANIMAFGEQLKISSDSLVPGGDSAADCAAIGVLLEEVLGARQNAHLTEPFAEIARNCLMADPAVRWNIERIEACLRGDPAPAARAGSQAMWWGLAAATAVILGLISIWPSQDDSASKSVAAPAALENVAPASNAPEIKPPAEAQVATAPKQPQASAAPEKTSANPPVDGAKAFTEQRVATLEGITQVLPQIPQAALNTITGRVRINVRVRVDSAGNVSQATLETPRASKYFTDRVLVAAQAWKFPTGNAPQDWMLRFELTREPARVSVAKIAE